MAVLLITHDLGIVAGRADRVAVMYAGRIVEEANVAALYAHPAHPYTRGLLASLPRLRGPRSMVAPIPGTVPLPGQWPAGCRFQPRCAQALPQCGSEPPWTTIDGQHRMRCWLSPPAGAPR
jgi:oligopeptide/dipeptide ABC transporter ATP-binding protein